MKTHFEKIFPLEGGRNGAEPHDESRPSPSMKTLRCMPAAALAGGLNSRSSAAKHNHGTAQPSPTGCAGSSNEAALSRPQTDALLRERGAEDGRDASDVDGAVAARADRLDTGADWRVLERAKRSAGGDRKITVLFD